MGVAIAEPTVRVLVRRCRQGRPAAYVPLAFGPGERAEFDFGHALVVLGGVEQQVPYLAGRLRYSGAMYLECFPTERQECFLLGQRHAFEFWGGVPRAAVYDNLAPAVAAVLAGHRRTRAGGVRPLPQRVWVRGGVRQPGGGLGEGERGEPGGLRAAHLPGAGARGRGPAGAQRRGCVADCARGPGAGDGRPERADRRAAGGRAGGAAAAAGPSAGGWGCCGRCWCGPRRMCASRPTSTPCRWAWWAGASPCAPTRWRCGSTPGRSWWPSTRAATGGTRRSRTSATTCRCCWRSRSRCPSPPRCAGARCPRPGRPTAASWWPARPEGNREFARVLALCLDHPLARGHRGAGAGRGRRRATAPTRCAQLLGWAARPRRPHRWTPTAIPRYRAASPPPDLSRYNRLLAGAEGRAMSDQIRIPRAAPGPGRAAT